MTFLHFLRFQFILALLGIATITAWSQPPLRISNNHFNIQPNRYGLSEISRPGDTHPTNYVREGHVFGDVSIRYVHDKKIGTLYAARQGHTRVLQNDNVVHVHQPDTLDTGALKLHQSFSLQGDSVVWTITLENTSDQQVRIEDLALPLYYNSMRGEGAETIFERSAIKHHFISGNNSFLFWERPTGLGPYLLMTPLPGTALEYLSTAPLNEEERVFKVFIHSAFTGDHELRGTWRQPHSSLVIEGKKSKTYGFRFRWTKDYNALRNVLVSDGLIDVQVAPGMTVPTDLDVRLALRTRQPIHSIVPEFEGNQTRIRYDGKKDNTHLYTIRFSRLGENKITVNYGDGYSTILEFFVTEPLETLYKKRAAFLVNRQQHKDSSRWYDGLFGVYDMKNAVLRGPDNADYLDTSRLAYVLTCDDPGLCKAPYLAAKNVVYPDQKEIDALEYYIEHFVWGKLQRTDKETPYPYGIYGIPDWKTNRDPQARAANKNDKYKDRMKVWRSYDYPHIFMLYYHLYQIASMYPGRTHYLDKKGYLVRAAETAKAYFRYPYDILPWYETYKWGCYNELLLPEMIETLNAEGYTSDANFLRQEWEKKAKYFIYDDPYPFRSEYAVDATAFESTYALAKYGVLNTMQPDSNLWYDTNLKRWYSHPSVKKEDAAAFMERQLQANLALRGVVEPAYYYLGSDFRGRSEWFTLTYMAQMGGWSILDQALHFSDQPGDYLRIGYQSYLSAFALINSGTADSNYGFWYPGKENDGASGWAFEPQKYTTTWIQKPQGRGPWYYDGETDLGYAGALRSAATIVTQDSIFGLMAYGGEMTEGKKKSLLIIPRDGLRQKLYYRVGKSKIDLILSRDGFRANIPVTLDPAGKQLRFELENRSGDKHTVMLHTRGLSGTYRVRAGAHTGTVVLTDGQPVTIPFPQQATLVVSLDKIH